MPVCLHMGCRQTCCFLLTAVGYKERFSLPGILRALINTPKIRLNRELHTDCRDSNHEHISNSALMPVVYLLLFLLI